METDGWSDWIKIYPSILAPPPPAQVPRSTNCILQHLLVVVTAAPIAASLARGSASHVPPPAATVHSRAVVFIHVGRPFPVPKP